MAAASGSASSTTPEMLAIAWATVWSLANVPGTNVHIHSDSQIALIVAQFGPTLNDDSKLGQVLAGLSMALQAICQVKYFHVHSHEWQPWNELADPLAKVAALLDVMPEVPPLHCLLDLGLAD